MILALAVSPVPTADDLKTCTQCMLEKPISAFSKKGSGSSVRVARCKACANRARKIWRAKNPREYKYRPRKVDRESRERSRLKTYYGITPEVVEAVKDLQGGKCAICETTDFGGMGKRLHIDHDHATKKFRGLLCTKCNTGIGLLNDSPALVVKALSYLNQHKQDALFEPATLGGFSDW